jgi:predicted HNH restriction endonuclease
MAITEYELQERTRKEKRAAYMRQYYDTHPEAREKKRQRDRDYAAANRQKAKTKSRAYYEANKEYVKMRESERQRRLKEKAVAYLGGACVMCGFNAHLAALQFHHRDPETKRFSVSTKVLAATKKFPWEMICEELDKCDILCANCHAVHHSAWDLQETYG